MISIDDLREGLKTDPTERGFFDLADDTDYCPIHIMTRDLAYLGVFVIPCEEGVAILPFTESLIDEGYEQIDVEAIHLLTDRDEIQWFLDRALEAAERLQRIALQYLLPLTQKR